MKKLISLAIAVALTTFSCTNDENNEKTTATQFADASLSIKPESTNLTGRDVERGTLHAWIKSIHVEAHSIELIHNVNFDFDLVPNGTFGADNGFKLEHLAIGRNDLTITTTTNTEPSLISTRSAVNAPVYMEIIQKQNPYAVYSATSSNNIVYGQLNVLNPVLLKTKNGRHIALFKLSDQLAALGVRATVTPIIDGVVKRELEFNTELLGRVYWSDANCVAGKTIKYNIQLLKPNGQPLMDDGNTPVGFTSVEVTIQASTSINRTYLISKTSIEENGGTQVFTAESWNNDNDNTNVNLN